MPPPELGLAGGGAVWRVAGGGGDAGRAVEYEGLLEGRGEGRGESEMYDEREDELEEEQDLREVVGNEHVGGRISRKKNLQLLRRAMVNLWGVYVKK